jgi:YVTN family beta-propeller protein
MHSTPAAPSRVAPFHATMAVVGAFMLVPVVLAAQAREYLYLGNSLGGDISVIAIPSHKVVGTIPATVVGNHPDDVIASRNGDVLYISRLDVNDVIAVSTETEQVLWRAEVPGVPNHLTLSPDEQFLYVPVYDKGLLAVVDTKTHQVVAQVEVGKGPHGTQLGPTGKYVYIGNMESNDVAVVEVGSHRLVKRIPLPEGVRPFQITSDEKYLFAQLSKLHGFVVVDLANDSVIRTVALPTGGKKLPEATLAASHYVMNHGLGISPDRKYLIANGSLIGIAAIYSMPDLQLLGTVPVGREPNWVTFSRDSKYAYVSNRRDNTLSVISIPERKEVARLKVGEFPQRMTTTMVAHRPN